MSPEEREARLAFDERQHRYYTEVAEQSMFHLQHIKDASREDLLAIVGWFIEEDQRKKRHLEEILSFANGGLAR